MPKYTTRVELHHHQRGDYDRLHDEMAKQGFTRTIVDDNGNEFHLPTAEYNYVGPINDKHIILRRAIKAARVVKPDDDFEVLVTKSHGRTAHNLKPV